MFIASIFVVKNYKIIMIMKLLLLIKNRIVKRIAQNIYNVVSIVEGQE